MQDLLSLAAAQSDCSTHTNVGDAAAAAGGGAKEQAGSCEACQALHVQLQLVQSKHTREVARLRAEVQRLRDELTSADDICQYAAAQHAQVSTALPGASADDAGGSDLPHVAETAQVAAGLAALTASPGGGGADTAAAAAPAAEPVDSTALQSVHLSAMQLTYASMRKAVQDAGATPAPLKLLGGQQRSPWPVKSTQLLCAALCQLYGIEISNDMANTVRNTVLK